MTTTDQNGHTVQRALTCPEREFATRAMLAVLDRNPTMTEAFDIQERRKAGVARDAILRSLLRKAANENRPAPPDWSLCLPRCVDVSKLLTPNKPKTQFIVEAYQAVLGRTPSPPEIAAQARANRWPRRRSDFIKSLANSAEAEAGGGEITLLGLGPRERPVKRFFRRLAGRNDSGSASEVLRHEFDRLLDPVEQLSERLLEAIERLSERLKEAAELERTNTRAAMEQLSALGRQASNAENTLNRLRTRMETEGAKTAEIASDTRLMQEVVRDVRSQVAEVHLGVASLRSHNGNVEESVQEVASRTREIERETAALRAHVLPPVVPGGDTVVVQVDGFFIGVPIREWRLSTYYHNRGPLEPGVYKLFQNIIRPGMVVVDVGANVGLYTLLAARLLQSSGSVFSFEPTPEVFRTLKNNVQLNGFAESGVIHLHDSAVTDQAGSMTLYADLQDSTHNSLFALPYQKERIQVPTVAIDDLLTWADLVKIDAEGAEPLIIRGMRQLIAKNPELRTVLEFAPEHIRRSGTEPEHFLGELRRDGLTVQAIDSLSGELSPVSDQALLRALTTNVLVSRA